MEAERNKGQPDGQSSGAAGQEAKEKKVSDGPLEALGELIVNQTAGLSLKATAMFAMRAVGKEDSDRIGKEVSARVTEKWKGKMTNANGAVFLAMACHAALILALAERALEKNSETINQG